MTLKIAIVAGEHSGDLLGAGLLKALKQLHPNIQAEGIAGPQLIAAGCKPLFPMEEIAVMGIVEVVKRIPQILSIRRKLTQHFLKNPPDIFIGIDAPDFNLTLEKKLKSAGIRTVHYVSPTVWAWRQGRLKKIKQASDLMLTLFPFEKRFYEEHQIPVKFVGHSLADQIPFEPDITDARAKLNISPEKKVVALMPGSRAGEIDYMGELFIRTAQKCYEKNNQLFFLVPMVNAARKEQFISIWKKTVPDLPIQIVEGQSQCVMTAADVILLASGTATLEAMLLKKPMVVAYRVSPITYYIVKKLATVSRIALPNLLSDNLDLVPEYVQKDATVENLSRAVLNYLENPEMADKLKKEFLRIHEQLRCDANQKAAEAVLGMGSDPR